MSFYDEIVKQQRVRRAYVRFAADANPGVTWPGVQDRRYAKAADNRGPIPIKGTVQKFGTFSRAIANHEIAIETPTIITSLLDTGNEWRGQGDNPSDHLLYRWLEYYLRVHDDAGDMYDSLVTIGQITKPSFPPGGKVSLNVRSAVGDFMGEVVPRRLVSLADWPRAIPESVGQPVPFVYGSLANTVATWVPGPSGSAENPPCTNLSAETAVVISSLPYSATEDVLCAVSQEPVWDPDYPGTGYGRYVGNSVWFTYTTQADEYIIGVRASADPASDFKPYAVVYYGLPQPGTPPYVAADTWNDEEEMVLVPVNFAGEPLSGTIYIEVFHEGAVDHSALTEAVLKLQVATAPRTAAPAGSLVNFDWNEVFPCLLSATDGATLNFQPTTLSDGYPIGTDSKGDILPNGISCDAEYTELHFFSPTLVRTSTYTGTPFVWNEGDSCRARAITQDGDDTFYVMCENRSAHPAHTITWTVHSFSSAGIHLDSWGPLDWYGGAYYPGLAVSRDGTVLYYTTGALYTGIKRWDLVNDVALSDLVAARYPATNYTLRPDSLVVMDDGTIVAAWQHRNSLGPSQTCRYNTSGTLLNYIDFDMVVDGRHLEYYHDGIKIAEDGTSFWIRHYTGEEGGDWVLPDVFTFNRVRASDMQTLASFWVPAFNGGAGSAYETIDDPVSFGPCMWGTWFVSRAEMTNPTLPPSGGGTVVLGPTPACPSEAIDQGASNRGGWLRGLLVDTGIVASEEELETYNAPSGVVATLATQPDPAPSNFQAAVSDSPGSGASAACWPYYTVVAIVDGVLSEMAQLGPISVGVGQKVTLSWDAYAGADNIRVFRSQLSDYGQFVRYRYEENGGYPPVDLPGNSTGLVDYYPNLDGQNQQNPDTHWDMNYRQQKYYEVSAVYDLDPSGSVETACSTVVMVWLAPRNETLSVDVSWADMGADHYIIRRLSQEYHFDIAPDREWTVAGTVLTLHDPLDDTTAVTACGSGQLPDLGGTTVDGPVYLLAGHNLKAVREVFQRQSTPEGGYGQVLLVEDVDYRQQVFEINGNRYHCIVMLVDIKAAATCEFYEITANVDGVEDVGDGTGDLITDGPQILKHILLNVICNTYRTGAWFTDLDYAPGFIDTDSFDAATVVGEGRISGGYLGAGAIVEAITARELIQDLLRTFDLDFYFHLGQWHVSMFNPSSITRANLPSYAPDDVIFKETFQADLDETRHTNLIPYFAGPIGPLGVADGYLVSGEVSSSESIARFGVRVSDPIYLRWTQDAQTAWDVMTHYLLEVKYPPITATFTTSLKSLADAIASAVKVTHPDGLGSSAGWVNRVCLIYRSDLDFDRLVTNITVRDVDRLVP